MLLEMQKNTVFPLVNMEMEGLNKHCFIKMKMGVYVKISVIGTVACNFIKRNEILQPNILIYFKAIFIVI